MTARTTRFRLLISIFAVAACLLVPASASAHTVSAGWTTFYGQPSTYDRCAHLLIYGAPRCASTGHYRSVSAWRWHETTRSWSQVTVEPNQNVYQYPYSGDWVWIWTSNSGWLVTEHRFLHQNYAWALIG